MLTSEKGTWVMLTHCPWPFHKSSHPLSSHNKGASVVVVGSSVVVVVVVVVEVVVFSSLQQMHSPKQEWNLTYQKHNTLEQR